MSKRVLIDPFVVIDGIDATTYTRMVAFDLMAEEIDVTPLGAVGYRETMGGERTIDVELDVLAGNSSLQGALRSAYSAGTAVNVQFRPRSAAQSSTNPTLMVSCEVIGFAPFGGAVGEAARPLVKLVGNGPEAIDSTAVLQALVIDNVLMVAA